MRFDKNRSIGCQTDLEEAAQLPQGALGPQETPGENGADLFAHGVEMGDEAVRHLSHRGEVTQVMSDVLRVYQKHCAADSAYLHVLSFLLHH